MESDATATVQVDFTLAVGTGRLEASLPVPAGRVTLTGLLPVLQSLSSLIVDSAIEIAAGEGHRVSCRAGCGACCRQLVPLSLFEAEALAAWIETLAVGERQALEGRFHDALVALRDAGVLALLDPERYDAEGAERRVAIDYLAAKVACPFLVEESCSIHPIRPLVCREYLVTSPAVFCADPSHLQVAGLPVPVKLSPVLYTLGAQVERSRRGWIPLVFLLAWMKGGLRPGDAIAGAGPELLYEIVRRLATAKANDDA